MSRTTRSLTLLFALLAAASGCAPESHALLSSMEAPVFTDCDALDDGIHMDRCDFAWGTGCTLVNAEDTAAYQVGHSAECADGDLLVTDSVVEAAPVATTDCDEPFEGAGGLRFDVAPTTHGCADVTFCGPGRPTDGLVRWTAQVCQSPPGPARTREEGAWTTCDGLIAEARDGEPCAGALVCAGDREVVGFDPLPLIAWCDAGVLRIASRVIPSVP